MSIRGVDHPTATLSVRQRQVYDLLVAWQRSAPAAELAREMKRRHGVGASQTYDILGRLRKKGYVVLISVAGDREWGLADA